MTESNHAGTGKAAPLEPGLDERLFVALRTRWHPRPLERALVLLSMTGNWGLFWVGLAALIWLLRWSWGTGFAMAAAVFIFLVPLVYITLGVNYLVKVMLHRERPDPGNEELRPLVRVPSSLSFPSSHAAMSFAAAGVLTYFYPQLFALFYGLALVMSWSRVYVGVHYPSDVVAGTAIGLIMGGMAVLFLNWV